MVFGAGYYATLSVLGFRLRGLRLAKVPCNREPLTEN